MWGKPAEWKQPPGRTAAEWKGRTRGRVATLGLKAGQSSGVQQLEAMTGGGLEGGPGK